MLAVGLQCSKPATPACLRGKNLRSNHLLAKDRPKRILFGHLLPQSGYKVHRQRSKMCPVFFVQAESDISATSFFCAKVMFQLLCSPPLSPACATEDVGAVFVFGFFEGGSAASRAPYSFATCDFLARIFLRKSSPTLHANVSSGASCGCKCFWEHPPFLPALCTLHIV